MFFSEHRLKMTSLRIGKHRIVKNIASLRKVNIAHPYRALAKKFTLTPLRASSASNSPSALITRALWAPRGGWIKTGVYQSRLLP